MRYHEDPDELIARKQQQQYDPSDPTVEPDEQPLPPLEDVPQSTHMLMALFNIKQYIDQVDINNVGNDDTSENEPNQLPKEESIQDLMQDLMQDRVPSPQLVHNQDSQNKDDDNNDESESEPPSTTDHTPQPIPQQPRDYSAMEFETARITLETDHGVELAGDILTLSQNTGMGINDSVEIMRNHNWNFIEALSAFT